MRYIRKMSEFTFLYFYLIIMTYSDKPEMLTLFSDSVMYVCLNKI